MRYGQEIKKSSLRLTIEEKESVQSFNCGNEVINDYLKNKACDDTQAVTFIVKDMDSSEVICYYSLSCSGLILEHGHANKITVYPAVEIKMFAIDEKYQHLPYSEDADEGNLSDMLFSDVISYIYDFTDNQCGADKIILYSVPDARSFYIRNGFCEFREFMKPSESWFTDDCEPMYMDM